MTFFVCMGVVMTVGFYNSGDVEFALRIFPHEIFPSDKRFGTMLIVVA